MNALLSKSRLNRIRRQLYGRGAKMTFFKVTPSVGETEIGSVTTGFTFVRERRAGQEIDGSGVKVWLAEGAISRSLLHVGAVAVVTVNNRTFRYKISELLPQQQIGAGYVMRLSPLQGATT